MVLIMSSLTFYGGVEEIGGNKILLETHEGTVLLDFGRRMGLASKYYTEFLQIRSKNALRDLMRLGLLPPLNGIYAPHFIDTTGLLEEPTKVTKLPMDKASDYWKTTEVSPYNPASPGVDGVFISHAHFDHLQDVSFLDPAILIYSTQETKALAKAITDVSQTKVDQQFYELRRNQMIIEKSENYKTLFPGELDYKNETEKPKLEMLDEKTGYTFTHEYTPRYRTFITESEGNVKGIKYRMIPVDHSLPGACSVVLDLPDGKRILYTGDIRFQGSMGLSIDDYVQEVGGSIDVIITEGTRVENIDVLTESTISDEIRADIEKSEGLVLIDFGWKDVSRFNIVYKAAVANDRTMVIQPKLAYLLFEFYKTFGAPYQDPRAMDNLRIYLKREGGFLYSGVDYAKFKMGYLHFHGRNAAKKDRNIVRIAEKLGIGGKTDNTRNPLPEPKTGVPYPFQETYDLAVHHLINGIKAYEIREAPEDYVIMFSYWDSNELFDLIPQGDGVHNTRYIRASTAPFNDEMVIDEGKFMKWLDTFKVTYDSETRDGKKLFTRRHISGHASKTELEELIRKINPEMIIPIHTEHGEEFEKLFPGQVQVPTYGQPLNLIP